MDYNNRRVLLNLAGMVADVTDWPRVERTCPDYYSDPEHASLDDWLRACMAVLDLSASYADSIRENERDLYDERGLLTANRRELKELMRAERLRFIGGENPSARHLLDAIGGIGDRRELMGAGWDRVWNRAQDLAYRKDTDAMTRQLRRLQRKHEPWMVA